MNENEDFSQLINVMRKLCLQTSQEHSLRTAIFFTYIKIGNDFYKVIIDSASSVNAISEKALKQLGLPFEKHPNPYEVSDGYYVAYKPITLSCILFMFIEMKFIHCHSCMMFAMKSMSMRND